MINIDYHLAKQVTQAFEHSPASAFGVIYFSIIAKVARI